jgi:hypothetical protein
MFKCIVRCRLSWSLPRIPLLACVSITIYRLVVLLKRYASRISRYTSEVVIAKVEVQLFKLVDIEMGILCISSLLHLRLPFTFSSSTRCRRDWGIQFQYRGRCSHFQCFSVSISDVFGTDLCFSLFSSTLIDCGGDSVSSRSKIRQMSHDLVHSRLLDG